jgi:hypothetical protein
LTHSAAARNSNPILYPLIPLLAVCISWLWTPLAAAQNCDYPATGKFVSYSIPPDGTKIIFEDVTLRAETEQTRRELAFTTSGGTSAETEWTIHMASGQAIAVRTFLGLLQTANSSGTASDFNRNHYASLWPLDAGKSVVLPMTTITQRGTQYASTLSLCVRRYETLKLPAGNFETVVIDAHRQITSGGKALPFDEVFPQFGIYLQRVRAMYQLRREVMKQTRRALSVSGG